jgi:hypothetical protein
MLHESPQNVKTSERDVAEKLAHAGATKRKARRRQLHSPSGYFLNTLGAPERSD